jgi:hypothetical protein
MAQAGGRDVSRLEEALKAGVDVMPGIVNKLREMSPVYVKRECDMKDICAHAHACDVAQQSSE